MSGVSFCVRLSGKVIKCSNGVLSVNTGMAEELNILYEKVKPNNPGDITAECSMLARYKHANSMYIQSWLFCIKNEAQ